MRKVAVIFSLTLLPTCALAVGEKDTSIYIGFDFSYGKTSYIRASELNESLFPNTLKLSEDLFGITYKARMNSHYFGVVWRFERFATINVAGESISMRGNMWLTEYGYSAFPDNRVIDINLGYSLGISTLKVKSRSSDVFAKNLSLLAGVFVKPTWRVVNKYTLSPKVSYLFDFSNPEWKKLNNVTLPDFRMSKLLFEIMLGIDIFNEVL